MTTVPYEDYLKMYNNKQQAETEHAQTGQWNAALAQQNQAIRDKYGMGADNHSAEQFQNAYGWMYNGQNQQQTTPYDKYFGNIKAQYDAAMQQAQAAREAQTKQAIAGIENMRPGIQQSAEEQARQAYVNNQRNVNMLPWQMKMLGLTGGAAESSLVGENARFGNLHGQIMSERERQLRDLENAKQQAQMQGDYDIASLQSDFARQAAEIYAQMAGRQLDDDIDTLRWNRQTAYDDRVRNEGYAREDKLLAGERDWQQEWRNAQWNRDDSLRGIEQDLWKDRENFSHGLNLDTLRFQYANQPKTTSGGGNGSGNQSTEDYLKDIFGGGGNGKPTAPSNYPLSLTKAGSTIDLGYGPLSTQQLNQLIQSGEVEVTQNNDGSYSYARRKNPWMFGR